MILVWILVITFVSGLAAWLVSLWSRRLCRLVCFVGLGADAVLIAYIWVNHYGDIKGAEGPAWILEYRAIWIAPLGISFHLAIDGLSLMLAALTVALGISSVAASWREIEEKVGGYHFALMAVLTGILGVFAAMDMFLFYFFWELMLVPMFFLILMWGHENRVYAAIKFFVFTQAGGLFMLLSIIALYWIRGRGTGEYTFDYSHLFGVTKPAGLFVGLGFFIAFAVKLPVVGVHVWLPDAHTEAPTAGSVILAGLLLKTGGYGFIRFVLPFLEGMASRLTPAALALGVAGIIYGALMAFAQQDLKRLVAYTSVSHLGFVLLGVFAGNQTALQGAVIVMLAHGLSTGALFIIIGALQKRIETRDMAKMGGFWSLLPRMGAMTLFFALASLGLPGLANFVGEFLVLAGTFEAYPWLAGIGALGFVLSSVYSLYIIYRVFQGPLRQAGAISDLRLGEMVNLSLLAVGVLWIGLFPQAVLKTAKTALQRSAAAESAVVREDSAAPNRNPNIHTLEVQPQQ